MNEEIERNENEISEEEKLITENAYLRSENAELKKELFCCKNGIPDCLASDVIYLADIYSQKNGEPFEDCVKSVYARLSEAGGGRIKENITTGVRTEKSPAYERDILRKAFGLRS